MSRFHVELSGSSTPSEYKDGTNISFYTSGAYIHYDESGICTRDIQKAAKKITAFCGDCIEFSGEWSLEQQWSFVLGACGVNFNGRFIWSKHVDASELQHRLEALIFTKNLINQSPEDTSPLMLADQTSEWIKSLAAAKVSVKKIVGEDLVKAQYMGIYEVGRGSVRPPVLLELDYNPSGDPEADVEFAIIGKGITFDSGGYSIKASEGMLDMKCDMGGAATVTGALGLAIKLGLSKRVKLILCCAENLISGHAYKLGDIITYKNGTTVEIVNTDAEGRLVLADGLIAAGESGAKQIIDAATLTGAAMMAVGKEYNAVFGVDDSAVENFMKCATQADELHWRLPLTQWHMGQCPSPFADTANSRPAKGGGAGGASNAAGFLLRFAPNEGQGWVHVDLAAAYNRNGSELLQNGASAQGMLSIAKRLLS